MLWLKIPVLVAAIADAVQLPVPNSWFGQHKICWKCHQVSSLKKKKKKPQKTHLLLTRQKWMEIYPRCPNKHPLV